MTCKSEHVCHMSFMIIYICTHKYIHIYIYMSRYIYVMYVGIDYCGGCVLSPGVCFPPQVAAV